MKNNEPHVLEVVDQSPYEYVHYRSTDGREFLVLTHESGFFPYSEAFELNQEEIMDIRTNKPQFIEKFRSSFDHITKQFSLIGRGRNIKNFHQWLASAQRQNGRERYVNLKALTSAVAISNVGDKSTVERMLEVINMCHTCFDLKKLAEQGVGYGLEVDYGITYESDLDDFARENETPNIPEGYIEVYGRWGSSRSFEFLISEHDYLTILSEFLFYLGLEAKAECIKRKLELLRQRSN